jgi:hypothetical protein
MARSDKEAVQEEQGPEPHREQDTTYLDDGESSVCPACGGWLDFWACEVVCHNCGLKFTCDE